MQDGLIHSILKNDSPVNRKFMDQTETRQFQRWFGDSKVVDRDGEPLVVYHATDADFTVFDRERLGEYTSGNTSDEAAIESAKVGFWFSENDLREKTGNEKTMEAYLSLENPMETDLYTMLDALENMTAEEYRAELEEEGYDGLIVEDQEFGGKSYVAFKPNQIKSAMDNGGDVRRYLLFCFFALQWPPSSAAASQAPPFEYALRQLRRSRAAIGSGGKKARPFCRRKKASTSALQT